MSDPFLKVFDVPFLDHSFTDSDTNLEPGCGFGLRKLQREDGRSPPRSFRPLFFDSLETFVCTTTMGSVCLPKPFWLLIVINHWRFVVTNLRTVCEPYPVGSVTNYDPKTIQPSDHYTSRRDPDVLFDTEDSE